LIIGHLNSFNAYFSLALIIKFGFSQEFTHLFKSLAGLLGTWWPLVLFLYPTRDGLLARSL